uniref:acyl-CoA dehydrogenase C-terminal domain-containing protein n=1 Tax=Marinobacterium profundum TaxID=1714300 RepID=UPI000AE6AFE2
ELSYQGALSYARDRLQMRSLRGAAAPEKSADPIIVHPDVRRMLLTQKVFAEGGRAFSYLCAQLVDLAHSAEDPAERKRAQERLALLIPIAKGFLTEAGVEAASLGIQVFGGHGYIAEWGMEQILRDARIAPIYEGTNGIQALDLLGRKINGSKGALQRGFAAEVQAFIESERNNAELADMLAELERQLERWNSLTDRLVTEIGEDPAQLGAAAFDYMMYSGYTVLAYIWALSAVKAQEALAAGSTETAFYDAKLSTARFYFRRILPRNEGLAATMMDKADTLLELPEDAF